MNKDIVISIKTILYTFLLGIGVYLLFRLGTIIGILYITLILTISLQRVVQYFQKQTVLNKPLSRPVAVIITYLLVLLFFILLISIGIDPVVTQAQSLLKTLSQNDLIFSFGDFSLSTNDLVSNFVGTSGDLITATRSIVGNISSIASIFILSIYMSLDWVNIKDGFFNLFKKDDQRQLAKTIVYDCEQTIGVWIGGEITLMVIIGVMSYIALTLIGVNYPLAIALVAGLFEIIPILGPFMSSVLAFLVAITQSPVQALSVVGAFAFIQFLENNFIVPKVMQSVSGFSPIIILIALLIGSNLFGIVGALLAVPSLMLGSIILKHLI